MTDQPNPIHILVVDDETSLLEELRDFLGYQGWVVTLATDGAKALAALGADPAITVVLSDIRMPRMDGLSMADRMLRARGNADAIEVVVMTGHGHIEHAMQAVRTGVFDFLRKPMNLRDTLGVLQRAHDKAFARREAHARQQAELAKLRADYDALQKRLASTGTSLGVGENVPPEIARILSHELRTPLIPIMGLPELLDGRHVLPAETLNAHLADVKDAGARLLQISDDLVQFLAPADPGTFVLRLAPPRSILVRASLRLTEEAQAAGVKIAIVESIADPVETDERRLAEALARLVKNAIVAAGPGGQVELACRAVEPDSVAFSVRDHGRGMTPEEVETAKKPFHQVDMSASRSGGGMGLGLPLAIRMASALGGRLEIDSVPNEGTTATIVLPRHAAPPGQQ